MAFSSLFATGVPSRSSTSLYIFASANEEYRFDTRAIAHSDLVSGMWLMMEMINSLGRLHRLVPACAESLLSFMCNWHLPNLCDEEW